MLQRRLLEVLHHHSLRRCHSTRAPPSIGQILEEGVAGQEVTVRAWVKSLRRQKVNTFLHLEDGLSHHKIQVVLSHEQVPKPEDFALHSAVSVTGTLTESPNPERQRFELQSVTQVTPVNTLTMPFTPPNTQPTTTTHSQVCLLTKKIPFVLIVKVILLPRKRENMSSLSRVIGRPLSNTYPFIHSPLEKINY